MAPATLHDSIPALSVHPGRASAIALATGISALACATPAHAVDGCVVLLCFAAPSWQAIPQCVPPIRQVLRDLALGRPFPTCAMSGAGNSAYHHWSTAPGNCPPQYLRLQPSEVSPYYTCDYSGAVSVVIEGAQWTRTWWTMGGGQTVTEYSPVAKARFGTWETRFDDDYAAWLAAQQQRVCVDC